jgi:hypothetical protein
MAVTRQTYEHYKVAHLAVINAVREILAQYPPYRDTVEIEEGVVFRTNVKPNWWLLGTEMIIEVRSSSNDTQVSVRTESQWFITGDIFNFYNRYIRDFLEKLQSAVQ